jgi:hypothetical protein
MYKLKVLKIMLMMAVAVAALGGATMLLWNWLVPGLVVGAQPIDYLQALGVLALGRILTGGFGRHRHHHGAMQARWEKMSDEERQKFRAGMRSCRGHTAKAEPPVEAAAA